MLSAEHHQVEVLCALQKLKENVEWNVLVWSHASVEYAVVECTVRSEMYQFVEVLSQGQCRVNVP